MTRDFNLTLATSLRVSRFVRRGNQFSKARVGQGVAIVFVTAIPQRDCLPAS